MDDIYVHVNVNDRLELIQTDFIDNGIKHKSHISSPYKTRILFRDATTVQNSWLGDTLKVHPKIHN